METNFFLSHPVPMRFVRPGYCNGLNTDRHKYTCGRKKWKEGGLHEQGEIARSKLNVLKFYFPSNWTSHWIARNTLTPSIDLWLCGFNLFVRTKIFLPMLLEHPRLRNSSECPLKLQRLIIGNQIIRCPREICFFPNLDDLDKTTSSDLREHCQLMDKQIFRSPLKYFEIFYQEQLFFAKNQKFAVHGHECTIVTFFFIFSGSRAQFFSSIFYVLFLQPFTSYNEGNMRFYLLPFHYSCFIAQHNREGKTSMVTMAG